MELLVAPRIRMGVWLKRHKVEAFIWYCFWVFRVVRGNNVFVSRKNKESSDIKARIYWF